MMLIVQLLMIRLLFASATSGKQQNTFISVKAVVLVKRTTI